MAPRTIPGSEELGASIRDRRNELGLSIAEAAAKAHMGAKTWSRYEAGASIREDKLPNLLRALHWKELPVLTSEHEDGLLDGVTRAHEAWSPYIEKCYGPTAAACFAAASDVVHDQIADDLAALAQKPKGTHLGELDNSWLVYELPPQFLTRYDYDFVFALLVTMNNLRATAKSGHGIVPHTVMDELVLYLMDRELDVFKDLEPEIGEALDEELLDGFAVEFCDDSDFETFCFTPTFLVPEGFVYHFDRWLEPQFWVDDPTGEGESEP